MLRNNFKLFCMLMVISVFLPSGVFAASFGIYADYGSGSGEADVDTIGPNDFDIDTNLVGLGFQMETDPMTQNRVFSYRCQAGLESRDLEDKDGVTFELAGVMLNNTFAFGSNVSDNVRIWVGPQVLIGLYAGETDEAYLGDDISFAGVLFGLGIAAGANFALGNDAPIITTTVGIRSFGMAGATEWYDDDDDMTANGSEIVASVGIMF